MSIKPIDIQSMYPRTNDVSKTQNQEQQKNQALIQQQVKSTNANVENKMGQVVKKEESQKAEVKEKQEQERRQKQNKKKNKNIKSNEKDDKNEKKKINEGNNIIDIKI